MFSRHSMVDNERKNRRSQVDSSQSRQDKQDYDQHRLVIEAWKKATNCSKFKRCFIGYQIFIYNFKANRFANTQPLLYLVCDSFCVSWLEHKCSLSRVLEQVHQFHCKWSTLKQKYFGSNLNKFRWFAQSKFQVASWRISWWKNWDARRRCSLAWLAVESSVFCQSFSLEASIRRFALWLERCW